MYTVLLGYIDTNGSWWLLEAWSDQPMSASKERIQVLPGATTVTTLSGTSYSIDVLFPVLHGKYGEDGSVQGLAELLHVPYVGCGVESSAVCMNKDATKRLVAAQGVTVAPWITVRPDQSLDDIEDRVTALRAEGPWFVKPSRAGSSVGVTRVTDTEELKDAIRLAFQHDSLVLVEAGIIGRELEVAVLGNPPSHQVSAVGEIIAGKEFYDYDDKYSSESTSRTVLNADLPMEVSELIRQQAKDIYETLECRGLARVDFLLDGNNRVYLNEVNTLPGFTDISMYPKLWGAEGVSYSSLIDKLISFASEKR